MTVAGRRSPVAVEMFTPLPPTRTGVAHYSSMLLPALNRELEVVAVTTGDRRPATGDRIYQLGNNLHHEWIYRVAMEHPGVIVLHDLVLHHLIVEMTLARGDAEGYIAALQANHGAAGAAWGRGRAAGLHSEMGNFLFPASIDVANRSRAVIVHNRYAADRLRSFGVTTPVHVVPHPYEPHQVPGAARESIRTRHGFTNQRIIGLFGFLTAAKRSEVVLQAFAAARARESRLRLLVVGEPAPNIDVDQFHADGITFTGYVSEEEFPMYFAAVDRLVNLRYPTAGETSGTLIRAFAAGRPVAVSDYAQFAELPDDIVVKIPFGQHEVRDLADFFVRDVPPPAAAQQKWLEENASIDRTVQGYLNALSGGLQAAVGGLETAAPLHQGIPLFPDLELVSVDGRKATIRNRGDITLRARSYGEPAYRLIIKSGDTSRWLELPRDLPTGETATIDLPMPAGPVTFHHALESVPMLEPEAWARAALR